MVAQFQQQSQQPDASQEFLKSAAIKEQSESRNLEASALKNTADARKKEAETAEILAGIDMDKIKLFVETQERLAAPTIETVQGLPLQ